jgi:hypothetical protein
VEIPVSQCRTALYTLEDHRYSGELMTRRSLTRTFLWIAITAWAIGLGATVFDLLVLSTAWGRSPPQSFDLLPYGRQFSVDPGLFFQPLSAVILLGFGALLVIWAFTPIVFWPMISELWETHRGRLSRTDAAMVALVHRCTPPALRPDVSGR